MSIIEANLSLFKKDKCLIGFSLLAVNEYNSMVFCSDFIPKLISGNAGIYQLDNDKIIFTTTSDKYVTFQIEQGDVLGMKDLFSLKYEELHIIDCSYLDGGFKLFIKNHPEEYEIIPLTRVLN